MGGHGILIRKQVQLGSPELQGGLAEEGQRVKPRDEPGTNCIKDWGSGPAALTLRGGARLPGKEGTAWPGQTPPSP